MAKIKHIDIGDFNFERPQSFLKQSYSFDSKRPTKTRDLMNRKSEELFNTKTIKTKLKEFLQENDLKSTRRTHYEDAKSSKSNIKDPFRTTFAKRKQSSRVNFSQSPKQKMEIIEDEYQNFKIPKLEKLQQPKVRRKGSQLEKQFDSEMIQKKQENLGYRILKFMRKKYSEEKYSIKPSVAESFHYQQNKAIAKYMLNLHVKVLQRNSSRLDTNQQLEPWSRGIQYDNIQQDI